MRCQSRVRMGLFSSVTGSGTIVLIARILSDRDFYLPVLYGYRVGAHPQPGRGEALTGGDIELDAVPRAGDDLTLAHPRELPVSRGGAGHRAVDRSRAERTKLMGTDVWEGVKVSVHIEDADLDPPQRDHTMRARWKRGYRPHHILSHLRPLSPHHPNTRSPSSHPVLQLARGRRDAEQLQGVLAHDLALGVARHGQLHDGARVVEVVVRPVGSEENPLRSTDEIDGGHQVLRVVRFLDRLGREPHPLPDVLARSLLQKG